jgi:hypothetical protein
VADRRRITLCVEGVVTTDGRLIEAGALTWKDVLPVQDDTQDIIGSVVHIRREDDGRITGETDVPAQPGESMHITVGSGQFETDGEDFLHIHGGKIIGLFRSSGGWAWPSVPQEQS